VTLITLKSYTNPHVLVIDEMGYLGYGPDAADILSKVNLRYQKGKPILFTTNKSLKQWGRVLHDEELARAILDRTLHYGEHIRLNGQSYRLRGRKLEWTLLQGRIAGVLWHNLDNLQLVVVNPLGQSTSLSGVMA